jgi:hypothetical protein
MNYKETSLWKRTLAPQETDSVSMKDARNKLSTAFDAFRSRATDLGNQIHADMPQFTQHDVTHMDSLWEIASLIIGAEYEITPTEAFVLGGTFLTHDLGMSLASYQNGVDDLKKKSLWGDTVASEYKRVYSRPPTTEELNKPDESIEKNVIGLLLRNLHAEHAQEILEIAFLGTQSDSTPYYLIDTPEFRTFFGPLIGSIAHSHWWNIHEISKKLPSVVGAAGFMPNEWQINPLKLACILRATDACHVDQRRSPGFLRAIRKITGFSDQHWNFQEKLSKPILKPASNRLLFSSSQEFSATESDSWWLCYDTLQIAHRELGNVDSLLAENNIPRFKARGIHDIDEPLKLAKHIRVKGWEPIDVKIKIGNVAKIVKLLGGEGLYGQDDTIPLRELIQNASDAVRARRLLKNLGNDWGKVVVRYGTDNQGTWVEVEDEGLGMSRVVLSGPFLDFGSSFWGSDLMHTEFPSLEQKGFSSTGKYGIGFFSVFMWGECVKITTRRHDFGETESLVLEFNGGLSSRPLLRPAEPSERLQEGGTRIRVWLRNLEILRQIINGNNEKEYWTMEKRLSWLCPTIDINLYSENNNTLVKCVSASDWHTIEPIELIERISGDTYDLSEVNNEIDTLMSKVLTNSGEILGRACIFPGDIGFVLVTSQKVVRGLVTVGGFRSNVTSGIYGILIGESSNVSRSSAIPKVLQQDIADWATSQAQLLATCALDDEFLHKCATIVDGLGGNTLELPVAKFRGGWTNKSSLRRLVFDQDNIIIVRIPTTRMDRLDCDKIEINTIFVSSDSPIIVNSNNYKWPRSYIDSTYESIFPFLINNNAEMFNIVFREISDSWEMTVDELIRLSRSNSISHIYNTVIGTSEIVGSKNVITVLRKN